MKLNNKGFAITSLLYGILILFSFFVGSYLLALSSKNRRLESISSSIKDEYLHSNYIDNIVIGTLIKEDPNFSRSFNNIDASAYTDKYDSNIKNAVSIKKIENVNTELDGKHIGNNCVEFNSHGKYVKINDIYSHENDISTSGGFGYHASYKILPHPNEIFFVKMIAKIPNDAYIHFYSSPIGWDSKGKQNKWLTDVRGTNEWKEYIFMVQAWGDDAPMDNFKNTLTFLVDRDDKSIDLSTNNLIWQLAYMAPYTNCSDSKCSKNLGTNKIKAIYFELDDAVTFYNYNKSSSDIPSTWIAKTPNKKGDIFEIGSGNEGIYYLWAKDAAGNIVRKVVNVK